MIRDGSGYSPREVLVMAMNLPVESVTMAHLRGGPEFIGWGPDRYMLANVIDAVMANTHAFVSAHSKRRLKAPKPVWRPKDKQDTPKTNNFAAMARAYYRGKRK